MKDSWGLEYATLALRVEKHFEGFVDAYCGPEDIRTRIEKEEKQPLDTLFNDAVHLLETVPEVDKARKLFLEKQALGIKTTIQILQEEEIAYKKQVELFYDIIPEKVPDSKLEKQKDTVQDFFKGQNVYEALEKWRKDKEISGESLRRCIDTLNEECRKRTQNVLSLPEGERVDFILVNNKPWSGYNWYLGNYVSRVEINTDIPGRVTGLPSLIAHEAYPGHHVEHAVKEALLYKRKGFIEASAFVYNTPECLISEGIANAAFDMIFESKEEAYSFLNEKLGTGIEVEKDAAISRALDELYPVSGNASLMIHEENAELSDVVEYLVDVGLSTKERAEKQVQFMTNPLFRAYIFNYFVGKEIVGNALKKVNPRIFYENQICPSNLKYFKLKCR